MRALQTITFILLIAATASAQDAVTVGTVTGTPGATVDVPVSVRDVSGTTLGIDQPAGSRIQSFSLTVNYAPGTSVQSITFTRAGITSSLTPTFETSPASAGAITLLTTFNEATNLVPFTLNAAAPGNVVGHLLVTLAPTAPAGSTVTLTLDSTLTQLTDSGGNSATAEKVSNGRLTLVNGAINIAAATPTLSTWVLIALAICLAAVALRVRI